MKLNSILLILISSFGVCILQAQKFAPKNGECLVFIGQDLEAIGGLKNYNNGYSDFFETPAGITLYTNLSPNNVSFGHYNKGLDGLKTKVNWGSGDSCASLYLKDSIYKNCAIAIGLSFVNHEKLLAKGKLDHLIIELADWIKNSKRPIFLRIGYEFDGWEWNHYKKKYYLITWKRIHSIFQAKQIDNVAFVWQSKGTGSNQSVLEEWYPGDELVDWCAYSYFGQPDEQMIHFARKHKKPVFISEATPVRQTDNLFFDSDLKNPDLEKRIWKEWFIPFFRTIEKNSDVIKAFSYINSHWSSYPMWNTNSVFRKVDSRIQMSPFVSKKWQKEINQPKYLKASSNFWSTNQKK